MPHVARLSIAPVRSLGLEHPESIELTEYGVAEDRRFYLVDERGFLVDRLVSGALVQVAAHTDPGATRLTLAFPDGSVIDGPVELGDAVETDIYKRTARGHLVVGPWAEAMTPFAGRAVRLVRCDRPAGTRDGKRKSVSLVSDGSLRRLAREVGVEAIDARRFRMLIELAGADEHEEDTWVGGEIEIGSARLRITLPDARCAITTQDPDLGHRDIDTLRVLRRYRGFREGKKLDFGVLGEVAIEGRISVGDQVRVVVPGGVTYERTGAG